MTPNLDIVPIKEWIKGYDKPLIIAGPCSAESEKQVLATAREIEKINKVKVFRAGIWKPRTRPGNFEGVGEIGLNWIKKVKEETSMLTTVEVANAKHVELCLKYGIDILWLGARTTVNPFAVQEIADALRGVDIPVMVKNSINPDFQLWLGAMERLNKVGIKKLAAIHRGYTSYEESPFRNLPLWRFPIELKTLYPNLPIINDPSHIAGNRSLIPLVSQKAMDLDMNGLMIETHIQPSIALSDAKQQVTPNLLNDILKELIVRQPNSQSKAFKSKLDHFRNEIDSLDEIIFQKISSRMGVVRKIGKYKKENNVTILQVNRWDSIVNKRLEMAEAMGLSDRFLNKILPLIHQESIRIQNEIMNS